MRLCPELITTPSRTTTQPTGTSPFCKACGVTEISKAFSNHYNEKIVILITILPSSRAMSMNFSSSSFCSISLFFNCWSNWRKKIMPRKQQVAAAGEGSATQRRSGRSSADGPRSLDQRQRERARLARIASLERDNHQQDNTHMMKEQVGWLLFIENQIIPPGSLKKKSHYHHINILSTFCAAIRR